MKYKIVLVPFPFDDLSGTKLRPALCLSNYIGVYRHIVIAFITSNITNQVEQSDISVLAASPDFNTTGLKVDSAIRLHRLITLPEKIGLRILGELPNNYIIELQQKLKQLFEI